MERHGLTDGQSERAVVEGERDRAPSGTAGRALAEARQTACWHAALVAGHFNLRCRYQSRSRRLRFRDLSHDVYLRRVHHPEQDRAGSHVGPGRGVALSNHAADGRPDYEQAFGGLRAHRPFGPRCIARGSPRPQ